MKVAFFGRTSNGKSTVINALLGDLILPSGIGHTTSCFLSVNGTEVETPYVLTPGSDEKKNIQSLSQLAHELCQEKLDPSSLIRVNWPVAKCALLRNDIVLVDSPGIDVSPDLDSWIDNCCLDADVFVLVANSESTLTNTEKKFFNKVIQKLSRPNIFILNNRWDASASEPKMMAVKNQHMERTVGFLVNELKCIDQCEAKNRVFFVSAKEVLTKRMQENQGMCDTGAAIHAEGFKERLMEFEHFERKFEECISKSAIQTKFESHAVQGMQTTKFVQEIMEKIEAKSKDERQKCIEAKCSWEERLVIMDNILDHEFKNKIKKIKEKVKSKVATAMNDEIKRLGILVNQFDHPFETDPTSIETYKRDLLTHIADDLGRNLTERCGLALSQFIDETKQSMTDQLASLLPPEDRHEVKTILDSRHGFKVSYQLDIPNICSDFKEDLEFHSSLTLPRATGIMAVASLAFRNVVGNVIAGVGVGFGFVEYMENCRQSVVSMTSSNCSQQVKRELSSTFVQLCDKVREVNRRQVEDKISQLSEDITDLEKIESQARLFGKNAQCLEDQLSSFIGEYGLSQSKM
ncbi:mitofusin-2-like [Xenia sp. Carnegie-2017]|uniref:mitofusin-2-like n=1 Tax=Xenia sp. Carnegie-2017 TaxID=2897299 RepID=UPI001F03F808|nr:mitofusin-2-like [Xenia sp. Carnegie-2017]